MSALAVPLLVLIIIVVGVVFVLTRAGRGGGGEDAGGVGPVRRLFYYVLAFVALMVGTSGAFMVAGDVAERLWTEFGGSQSRLAAGLAMFLVGAPIWLFMWTLAQRSVRQHPSEAGTLIRKLYMYLTLGVTGALTISGLTQLLRYIFRTEQVFSGDYPALLVVWGLVWAYHWRVEAAEGQPTGAARNLRRIYVYTASLVGFALAGSGAGLALYTLLQAAYVALFDTGHALEGGVWRASMGTALSILITGGLVWWWHWLRAARGDAGAPLRQVYLYLFGVAGGAATALTALVIALFACLQWVLGVPDLDPPARHFAIFPVALAMLITGTAMWTYHATAIMTEARGDAARLTAASRGYRYLVSLLGLGLLATALGFLVVFVITLIAPEAREPYSRLGSWRSPLALMLGLVVVGAPAWVYHWGRVQGELAQQPVDARRDGSRRAYLYVVFGIAILTTMGSAAAVVYLVLRAALDGTLQANVLRDVKWGLGFLVSAGALAAYHWKVMQDDRNALIGVEPALVARTPGRKRVTVVAPDAGLPAARELESRLGYQVAVWRMTDGSAVAPQLSDEQLRAATEAIAGAPSDRVLVMIDEGGVRVLPYSEG